MVHNITIVGDGTAKINVDFSDELVDLQGETFVKGGETEALQYLPVFEADLRRNNSEKFPLPEIPEGGMIE
jgi:hypothetical protein